MTKLKCDRIVLWLTLAASAITIYGFESEISSRKKHNRQENNDQYILAEINQRLKSIEQQLDKLLPTKDYPVASE